MTAYEEAKRIRPELENDKWKLGDCLRRAVDEEQKEIREFALEVDGNKDHEDTYGNYVRAERFRLLCVGFPEYEQLMKLPISYWYTAFRSPMDFEDVVQTMLDCFLRDGKRRPIRWFDAEINPDKAKGFSEYLLAGMKWIKNIKPFAIGRMSALNVSEADYAKDLVYHLNEAEHLMNKIKELSE